VVATPPKGLALSLDVDAFRIKSVPGATDGHGRLASESEHVTLLVGDHLVTAVEGTSAEVRPKSKKGRK